MPKNAIVEGVDIGGRFSISNTSEDLAKRLASAKQILSPVTLIAAHPDDETLFAGLFMQKCLQLSLVIVFDDPVPKKAKCRREELEAALHALNIKPKSIKYLNIPEGEYEKIRELGSDISSSIVPKSPILISHTIQGGHPDHDQTAIFARSVVKRNAPQRLLEFHCYCDRNNPVSTVGFCTKSESSTRVEYTRQSLDRKVKALQCFESQREIIKNFHPALEWIRSAPTICHDSVIG